MIVHKNGSVLKAKENYIVQQVNHQGKMNAGLALQIKRRWPGIEKGYVSICDTISFEQIKQSGYIYYYTIAPTQSIACVFGQEYYGRNKQYTDYNALKNGFRSIAELCLKYNKTVAIPFLIGCGLGGGSWKIVFSIIDEEFKNVDVAIYKLDKKHASTRNSARNKKRI